MLYNHNDVHGKTPPCDYIVSPFGHAISLRIELIRNLAELGEDLMDDVLELLQALWANLGDIVHHHHRVYTISLLGLLSQEITKQL